MTRFKIVLILTALVVSLQAWFWFGSSKDDGTPHRVTDNATEQEDLPFGLRYFMTRDAVESHLVALKDYRRAWDNRDEIAYETPDPVSLTTNLMILAFRDGGLVAIDSWKIGLSQEQFPAYWAEAINVTEKWKALGATSILEDPINRYYLYTDGRSHFSISASQENVGSIPTFRVAVTISESQNFKNALKK